METKRNAARLLMILRNEGESKYRLKQKQSMYSTVWGSPLWTSGVKSAFTNMGSYKNSAAESLNKEQTLNQKASGFLLSILHQITWNWVTAISSSYSP